MFDANAQMPAGSPPANRLWPNRGQRAAHPLEREQEQQISAPATDSFSIKRWLTETENIAFIAAVGLLVIPIWWFQYFPSQDGPDYLQNARIIGSYNLPDFQIVREYYLINKSITPNWSIHLVLAWLMMLVGPLVAEKILLTGYVIFTAVVSAICDRGNRAAVEIHGSADISLHTQFSLPPRLLRL